MIPQPFAIGIAGMGLLFGIMTFIWAAVTDKGSEVPIGPALFAITAGPAFATINWIAS